MSKARGPIILEGQVYYHEAHNVYLVVTKKIGEMVRYTSQPHSSFLGVRGSMEDIDFIEAFQPVDPADLTEAEKQELLGYCQPGIKLKVGFIKEE